MEKIWSDPTLYKVFRSLFFLFSAELSHSLALNSLKLLSLCGLSRLLAINPKSQAVEVFGLQFSNPVGLAAGLDKNADYIDALGALGFGFIEVGTVTPKPQDGNALPRLFRLEKEQAIINRMGFNNKGVAHLVKRLQNRKYTGLVGVNIGKNLTTPVEEAASDYLYCLREVYALADYIVVNLSSPNTPGLRTLQYGLELDKLLNLLKTEQGLLQQQHHRYVPLLLKIAPDLNEKECEDIAQSLLENDFDGVIATNTTIERKDVQESRYKEELGGLSGAPLARQSTVVIEHFHKFLQNKIPIIGVGGIHDVASASAKFSAGASLVQLYTGFIYEGPALIADAIQAAKESGS